MAGMHRKTVAERLHAPGPKRILSLEGGGVRGLVTLGMLARVEALLAARVPEAERADFRLCDYFDLIGGTSTGALIATQLAMGESVDDVTRRYLAMCPEIFSKRRWIRFIESKLDSDAFDRVLQRTFKTLLEKHGHHPDADPTLESAILKTGLAVFMKRIDTGSAWVQSNAPRRKFWDRASADWKTFWQRNDPENNFYANRSYPLRKVVQASASAPFFLGPVPLEIDPKQPGLFLDGGASPFNDPSTELFAMAALAVQQGGSYGGADGRLSPHGLGWPTGKDNLYMLSLGTGTWRQRHTAAEFAKKYAASQAFEALRGIIADAQKNSVMWMQALSVPPRRGPEVDVMHYVDYNLGAMYDLRFLPEPLLTFRRASPMIDRGWLRDNLGAEFTFESSMIERLRELDRPEKAHHQRLLEIGMATGARFLDGEDFPSAFDIPGVLPAAV